MSKQDCLKTLEKQRARIDATIAAMAYIPAELEGEVRVSNIGYAEFKFDLPWDIKEVARVRRALGSNWKFQSTWTNVGAPADRKFIFRCFSYRCKAIPEASLQITMQYQPEQATVCQLVQIGVKELPVYEVVCN